MLLDAGPRTRDKAPLKGRSLYRMGYLHVDFHEVNLLAMD